ncbi:MAG: hypothetical protein QNJ55_32560 [Xenococcus sp. MO_188.B8]|nr:hypothetical protein [Xenococcus sp. MO_188.B8]
MSSADIKISEIIIEKIRRERRDPSGSAAPEGGDGGSNKSGAGMGEVLTSSCSAPSRRLNVISPIPAPSRFPRKTAPHQETGLTSDTNSSITL